MPELKKVWHKKSLERLTWREEFSISQSDDLRDVGHIRIVRDLHVPFGSLSTPWVLHCGAFGAVAAGRRNAKGLGQSIIAHVMLQALQDSRSTCLHVMWS